MLYNYAEVTRIYGNDYKLRKAILDGQVFKIENGIYSDGESNFTTIELILKKYPNSFLVKDSALHMLGFIDEKPPKIHVGTARNALRITDSRVQQHFYSNLDVSTLYEYEWATYAHILSYENVKRYQSENNNEIRLFNLKALLYDVLRNYRKYPKSVLIAILNKFKTCRYFYGINQWEVEENLRQENVVSDIEFLDKELYEAIKEIFDEVWSRDFNIKYDL